MENDLLPDFGSRLAGGSFIQVRVMMVMDGDGDALPSRGTIHDSTECYDAFEGPFPRIRITVYTVDYDG